MGFKDVVFLPHRVGFYITFLEKCGRGESLESTTSLITVVGRKQGHAPCKHFFFNKAFFCVRRMSWRS